MDLHRMHEATLAWYAAAGRDLAFRRTTDPWSVLVAEVMAQQTQAERAAAHWERFMPEFPTAKALAAASPADVIRAWRGLGYNRRALALRGAAAEVERRHGGIVPNDIAALEGLPGIGPYTARAVLAFAFGRAVSPLDTNVGRVLGRAFGLPASPSRARQTTADSLVPASAPAAWGHALMDIGATICRARSAACGACPLMRECPSAGRVTAAAAHPRAPRGSPPFAATARWLRGRIVDRLRDAPARAWVAFDGPIGSHSEAAVATELGRLAREGVLELHPRRSIRARLIHRVGPATIPG